MATVTLTDIDDELLAVVAELARRREVSVERQIVAVLEASVGRELRRDLVAQADRIAAMTPRDVEQTDSTLLIRVDRDR